MRKINEKITTRTEEDTPPNPDSNSDTRMRPDRGSITSPPRWVKVFGIIAIVLILLFVVLQFSGGGHGPGRHTPGGGGGSHGQHTTSIEQGVQQP